jgi:hypothetical protein
MERYTNYSVDDLEKEYTPEQIRLLNKFKDLGCVHAHVRDGDLKALVSHLDFPEDGDYVIHMKPDNLMDRKKFFETHPRDHGEWDAEGAFNLGDDSLKDPGG